MKKIIINRRNDKKAYEAFQSGTLAFAERTDKRFSVIKYDDPAVTNKEEKWSEAAFGNMLIGLLAGHFKEIYIITPPKQSIFSTHQKMLNAVKKNAIYLIAKEEETTQQVKQFEEEIKLWKDGQLKT